ncbi:MAG TPA: C4-dicarboxylate ABC transporter substrate-binding protein, partial [Roseovarius sp.]|nr:C4-dicarboxylate ABC transporter substrate-binding protein [Roseovarius sp.]
FASERVMGKLDQAQRDAVMRAAEEAGVHHREEMAARIDEIRAFLTSEGGMETAEFDRSGFIEAGLRVQDRYAADKGEAFIALVDAIRAEAE